MLHPVQPRAFVCAAVGPRERALPLLLSFDVAADVVSAVWILENTLALHFVVPKLAIVRTSISKSQNSLALL